MIPTVFEVEQPQNITITTDADLPTLTYGMILERSRMRRRVDGKDAMKQAIFKILQTERYQYSQIYSDNYGVEFWTLIGTPITYAIPEIERRITEALTWDQRITSVDNFEFTPGRNEVLTKFTAHTIFGDINMDNIRVAI